MNTVSWAVKQLPKITLINLLVCDFFFIPSANLIKVGMSQFSVPKHVVVHSVGEDSL